FSSRRRHTIFKCDWSSDVCSSDLRHEPHLNPILGIGACEEIAHKQLVTRAQVSYRVLIEQLVVLGVERLVHLAPPDFSLGGWLRSEERRVGKEGAIRSVGRHSRG